MDIEFDTSQLQQWIKDRIKNAQNLELIKRDISDVLLTSITENFDEESEPDGTPWEELNKEYEAYKQVRGKSEKKLIYNTDLYKSIDSEVTSWGVRSGSIRGNVKYARIHQKGGMAGRNRRVRIPARPYIGLNNQLIRKIKLIVEEHS